MLINEIKRVALRDLVHRNLLNRILHGDLTPGSRVKDTELSKEMDVSRTPVREALLRLVKESFLKNHIGKGFVVLPLTTEEVRDIYPIISSLEILALKTSSPLPPTAFTQFEHIDSEMNHPPHDFIRLIQLDVTWHKVLLSGCHNRRLLDMIEDLKRNAFRYEYTFMEDLSLVETSRKEHQDMVETLKNNGHSAVIPLLENHWTFSQMALLEKLKKQ